MKNGGIVTNVMIYSNVANFARDVTLCGLGKLVPYISVVKIRSDFWLEAIKIGTVRTKKSPNR